MATQASPINKGNMQNRNAGTTLQRTTPPVLGATHAPTFACIDFIGCIGSNEIGLYKGFSGRADEKTVPPPLVTPLWQGKSW
jgi:hypothetical protein